jgi:hypothetical protein
MQSKVDIGFTEPVTNPLKELNPDRAKWVVDSLIQILEAWEEDQSGAFPYLSHDESIYQTGKIHDLRQILGFAINEQRKLNEAPNESIEDFWEPLEKFLSGLPHKHGTG